MRAYYIIYNCILRANHADKVWRGIPIKRGSFYSSLDSLARETGLSVSQIRTSFKKLGMTGEVTSKPQATGRMIAVYNYDQYQSNDKPIDRIVTGKSQASDKQVTTNKNEKNEKNVRSIFTNVNTYDDWLKIQLNRHRLMRMTKNKIAILKALSATSGDDCLQWGAPPRSAATVAKMLGSSDHRKIARTLRQMHLQGLVIAQINPVDVWCAIGDRRCHPKQLKCYWNPETQARDQQAADEWKAAQKKFWQDITISFG